MDNYRQEYINMLKQLGPLASTQDKIFLESVIKGFNALVEGSMFIEYHPVFNKMINNEHVPSDNPDSTDPDEIRDDIVKWFYMKLELDSKSKEPLLSDNFFRMVVINPTPIAYKDGIKIKLDESPLWHFVKEEANSRLYNSPKYEDMKALYSNEAISDDITLRNSKKTDTIPKNIEDLTNKRDALKKNSLSKIGMHDIGKAVNDSDKKEKEQKQLKFSEMEKTFNKRIADDETKRAERFANLNSLFTA